MRHVRHHLCHTHYLLLRNCKCTYLNIILTLQINAVGLGERVVLDADPEPDDEPRPLFFQFCESVGVATVTWMIQLTWRSSRGIFS